MRYITQHHLCSIRICKNTYKEIHIKHIMRIYEKQYNMMVKSTDSKTNYLCLNPSSNKY